MAKVFIIYDTKYGNTKLVAEKITEGIRQVPGIETDISDVKEVDPQKIVDADVILIGAPNHIGSPSRTIMKFIDSMSKLELKAKGAAVFDTHMANDLRALEKMEKAIHEKAPSLKLIASSLPIRVDGMKGPITEGELPKCIDFGKKIATQLKP